MGEITLKKALDDYKTVYMPYRNFAERTRVEYQNDLEDLIRFFEQLGIYRVEEIGLPQLERYVAELDRRGIAGSTRKRKVVVIRSFLWYLYQDSYISTNLAKRLIPPFAEPTSPRYLTKSEYEHLLDVSSHNPRDSALIQLLLQTGIKLSELTRLTVSDVELPYSSHSKTGKIGYLHISGGERQRKRILPLNCKVYLPLTTYIKRRASATSPVLFLNRFRKPLSARGVEKILRKYVRKAGINHASVQSLRHTFAIHQVAKGTDIGTIQKVMGYEDPRSMSIYTSVAQGLMSKALKDNAL